jgi:hypothetical protein
MKMDPLAVKVLLNDKLRHLERVRRGRKAPQASKVQEFKDGGTKGAHNRLWPHEDMHLYLCPSVAKLVRKGKAKEQKAIQADCDREWRERG